MLSTRLMAILNLTPDSFSDGGRFSSHAQAISTAVTLLDHGAHILDLGAESTRPGSQPVPPEIQLQRLLPVIQGILALRPNAIISVDTRSASVALASINAGAAIINDVSGLQFDPLLLHTVGAHPSVQLCIMHSRGTPLNMQNPENLSYSDLIQEVASFLSQTAQSAISAGIPKARIILDPGLGFAKTPEHNWQLLRSLPLLHQLLPDFTLLIGHSRKNFLGQLTAHTHPPDRDYATAALSALLASANLPLILRVHNFYASRDALLVASALSTHNSNPPTPSTTPLV